MVARDLYDFESLKLVDKPDCDANVALPQTLRGSEGAEDETCSLKGAASAVVLTQMTH